MTDIRLLNNVDEDARTMAPAVVATSGGVNVYAAYESLGGGTLSIYETPDKSVMPNLPVYSSATGEPMHLNVTPGSYLIGELAGSTNAKGVVLGVTTMAVGHPKA